MMDSLRECRAGNVPVFIVLDHFHVFASRQRQTLLYNLFDITQVGTVVKLSV